MLKTLRVWLDRKYYYLFPEALFAEVLGYCGIGFTERLTLKKCLSDKTKWMFLCQMIETRKQFSPDELWLQLERKLLALGNDHGWDAQEDLRG